MRVSNPIVRKGPAPRPIAYRLTIFTATEISTASRWAAANTAVPANALRPGTSNCIDFAIAQRARRGIQRLGTEGTPAVRIPIPANDNLRLSTLPRNS